jgi:uncharacterized protein YndB with AHSA1/START domain
MPSLRISRSFSNPPETIFDAWLDPASAGQWLFTTADGEMTRVDIDARVGGGFNIVRHEDGLDAIHLGEYLEIDRPRRLEFTFWVEPYAEGRKTRVALDLAPDGEGGTELTLSHEDVPEEWVERTSEGWGMILANLAKVLEA